MLHQLSQPKAVCTTYMYRCILGCSVAQSFCDTHPACTELARYGEDKYEYIYYTPPMGLSSVSYRSLRHSWRVPRGRTFSVATPLLWNSFPRDAHLALVFKIILGCHVNAELFRQAFNFVSPAQYIFVI